MALKLKVLYIAKKWKSPRQTEYKLLAWINVPQQKYTAFCSLMSESGHISPNKTDGYKKNSMQTKYFDNSI